MAVVVLVDVLAFITTAQTITLYINIVGAAGRHIYSHLPQ